MALAKYGGGLIQLSGSIAGNTFARNRYGNYVRARTKPVNPKTAAQIAVRSALAYLTDRWGRTLTIAQRAAWNLYAANVAMKNRLGESIFLSGFNHYLRSNIVRHRFTYAVIDDGPTIFEIPGADPTYTISAVASTKTVTHNYDNTLPWANETGGQLWVSVGKPQNRQRNFFDGPWKVTGVEYGDDAIAPTSPYLSNSIWEIASPQRLWSYARISRADGRLSYPFRYDIIVSV